MNIETVVASYPPLLLSPNYVKLEATSNYESKETLRINFLRYAGSKRRLLAYIKQYFPPPHAITGRYIDPFVGGGGIFLSLSFRNAWLSDINKELMDLYRAIKRDPTGVWKVFESFPSTKQDYYEIRNNREFSQLDLTTRAARTLYLNRTCFRGWWRYNSQGHFNVGYGGQGRRWAISKDDLIAVSCKLSKAAIRDGDFESVISSSQNGDLIFIDPPYQPGEREMVHEHYVHSKFRYADHERLAKNLQNATSRGVRWIMTTSSHPDILRLFPTEQVISLPMDPYKRLRSDLQDSGEILIRNYSGV